MRIRGRPAISRAAALSQGIDEAHDITLDLRFQATHTDWHD
jgi:hypothetical protein